MCLLLAEVELGGALPSYSSSQPISKGPFSSLFGVRSFTPLCFLSTISLFKVVPKPSAEVLSGIPKHKKAVMCLREEIGFT